MSNWFTEKLKSWLPRSGSLVIGEGEIEDEELDAEEVESHGYVVVNLTQRSFISDGFLVMPDEMPCTYMTLNEALNLVAGLHEEDERHRYGETVRIYRLAVISNDEIRSMFDLLKKIQET
jgi:hypothetical protein